MNTDLSKAVSTTVDYLSHRDAILSRLLVYADDGVRAQAIDNDRNTGHSFEVTEAGESVPSIADPTGTAARPDPFRTLVDDCLHHERLLVGAFNLAVRRPLFTTPTQLVRPLRVYRGGDAGLDARVRAAEKVFRKALAHTKDANTRDETGRSADGDPGCESCARLKVGKVSWWNPPDYNGGRPTDLGGGLARKLVICRSCQRFAVEQEPTRLPTVDELRHRHDDPRGQWPKRYASVR